jgi:hypothetical protein
MRNMTESTIDMRPAITAGRLLVAALAAALALLASPAHAGDATEAVAVDAAGKAPLDEVRVVGDPVSAHDARRAAYRYLGELGYTRSSGIGAARVRSITREGDTWILRVAYSRIGRVLGQQTMLYVDANSALVSEVAPEGIDGRVAAR